MFAVATGLGDTTNRGLNHLAHEGLECSSAVTGAPPKIQELAVKNKLMAYSTAGYHRPLYRNIASGKAGLIFQVVWGLLWIRERWQQTQ